jgi:hypothetical protein
MPWLVSRQTVSEAVAAKSSDWTMTAGRGLPP